MSFSDASAVTTRSSTAIVSVIFSVFLFVGLGLLTGGLLVTRSRMNFLSVSIAGEGQVVSLETSRSSSKGGSQTLYTPVIEFTDASDSLVRFRGDNASSQPSYEVGETVPVRYLADNPNKAKIDSFSELWLLPIILSSMGIIFAAVGGGAIFSFIRTRARTRHVKKTGQRISADFTQVGIDSGSHINGQSPYHIYAQWLNPQTQKIHTFKSAALWFDPTAFIKTKKIDVVIDPNDPSDYWMDTSFLPAEG